MYFSTFFFTQLSVILVLQLKKLLLKIPPNVDSSPSEKCEISIFIQPYLYVCEEKEREKLIHLFLFRRIIADLLCHVTVTHKRVKTLLFILPFNFKPHTFSSHYC